MAKPQDKANKEGETKEPDTAGTVEEAANAAVAASFEEEAAAVEDVKDKDKDLEIDEGVAADAIAAGKKDKLPATEASKESNAKQEAAAALAAVGQAPEEEQLGDPIMEPADMDVLSGRGASVNNHNGNKKFRALCFVRKPLFEAGNHAAKRRIATEIVDIMMKPTDGTPASRFLKRKKDKGPYYAMTEEQAIIKAQQVMRDYKRPDRVALREALEQSGQLRRRSRTTVSTPLEEPVLEVPAEPIIENPFGVHSHDILCGRGAYVNGHVGNERLRTLAQERKKAFDNGSYTEKRQLATEIVQIIQQLDPPGRFLKRATSSTKSGKASVEGDEKKEDKDGEAADDAASPKLIDGSWEELTDDKAIHKACQVMRDIDRPDRKHREERKEERRRRKLQKTVGGARDVGSDLLKDEGPKDATTKKEGDDVEGVMDSKNSASLTALAEKAAVEVVDKALAGTPAQDAEPDPIEV